MLPNESLDSFIIPNVGEFIREFSQILDELSDGIETTGTNFRWNMSYKIVINNSRICFLIDNTTIKIPFFYY